MRKLIALLVVTIGLSGSGLSIPSNSPHPSLIESQVEAASFHQRQAEYHHDKKSKHHSAEQIVFSAKGLTILYVVGVVVMCWSIWYLKWAKEHDAL